MTLRPTDTEVDEEIAANLAACARFGEFNRDEAGWDEIWEGLFAILCRCKNGVRVTFGFDPRKSSLFGAFPDLLWAACDPQLPIVYSPVFREFGMPVFDGGPASTTIRFDPYTGKALPGPVRDAYFEVAEEILGHEVGILDDELDTLPAAFRGEQWWIDGGL